MTKVVRWAAGWHDRKEGGATMRFPLVVAIVVATLAGPSVADGQECPPPPAKGGLDFSLPCWLLPPIPEADSRVYFGSGSFDLSGEAKATLDRQVATLRQFPALKIELIGFADTREAPSSSEMEDLGQKRAAAVGTYLIEKGVEAGRITAAGYPYAPIFARRIDDKVLAAMRYVRTKTSDR
ncbi:OmpA family protein [Shumkonia mesophila]|uniref:OmpA family protein n=1 Tax=Shumkonia mesophila TaxID=2838854 RepID=UPI0029348938|nr:OmpA family protein [Shumkonia mesophila]